MNVNPFSLIGDKIDRKDIFAEYKGIMGDDIPSLDFNDYTTNGWYENTGTNRAGSANVPHAEDNGYLLVVSKSRTVYQYWYSTYQSLGTMVRARKNGTWGSWDTVALTSDIYKYTVLATANANQTYSAQLGQLQSTYNNLSIDYKNRVVIKRGGRIYYQGNTDKGEFTCQYATSALNVLTLNITDKTYKAFDGTNVVDYSSINNNAALELTLI